MAKLQASSIEKELVEARNRRRHGLADGAYYETISRLATLERSLSKLGSSADEELYRHFPVAAISSLETHFKVTVTTIVNSGTSYLERGLALSREKFMAAVDVLPLLDRRNISTGELISHLLPFNSVASLEKTFSVLLDQDLKSLVKEVRDPYFSRTGLDENPLVNDVSVLWENLAKTFERRHILAHESADRYTVTFEQAQTALTCVAEFSQAMDAILWVTIWKDAPLTQYEMNVHAANETRKVRAELAKKIKKALLIASEESQRARFRRMYLKWREYYKLWIQWQDEHFVTGSIRPLMAATNRTVAFKSQLADISNWISQIRPEEWSDNEAE